MSVQGIIDAAELVSNSNADAQQVLAVAWKLWTEPCYDAVKACVEHGNMLASSALVRAAGTLFSDPQMAYSNEQVAILLRTIVVVMESKLAAQLSSLCINVLIGIAANSKVALVTEVESRIHTDSPTLDWLLANIPATKDILSVILPIIAGQLGSPRRLLASRLHGLLSRWLSAEPVAFADVVAGKQTLRTSMELLDALLLWSSEQDAAWPCAAILLCCNSPRLGDAPTTPAGKLLADITTHSDAWTEVHVAAAASLCSAAAMLSHAAQIAGGIRRSQTLSKGLDLVSQHAANALHGLGQAVDRVAPSLATVTQCVGAAACLAPDTDGGKLISSLLSSSEPGVAATCILALCETFTTARPQLNLSVATVEPLCEMLRIAVEALGTASPSADVLATGAAVAKVLSVETFVAGLVMAEASSRVLALLTSLALNTSAVAASSGINAAADAAFVCVHSAAVRTSWNEHIASAFASVHRVIADQLIEGGPQSPVLTQRVVKLLQCQVDALSLPLDPTEASDAMEGALLPVLCCVDDAGCAAAAQALNLVGQLGTCGDRASLYKLLLESVNADKSQPHKGVRHALRRISTSAPPVITAFQRVSMLWTDSTTALRAKGGVGLGGRDERRMWSLYMGFVCGTVAATATADAVLQQMVTLAVDEDAYTHSNAVSVAAHSLSSSLLPKFLIKLRTMLNTMSHQVSKTATLLVEAVTLLLKHTAHHASDLVAGDAMAIDVEGCAKIVMLYASQLDWDRNSIWLRTRVCELLESLVTASTSLPFENEARFRCEALELLASWDTAVQSEERTQSFSVSGTALQRSYSTVAPSSPIVDSAGPASDAPQQPAEKPKLELSIAIARAAAALHEKLRLPGDMVTRTALFSRSFTFLTSAAGRAVIISDAVLAESVGAAAAALVSSNSDVALASVGEACNQRDESARAAFLDAVSRALRCGAWDATPPPPPKGSIERFVDALVAANMEGALAVCTAAGAEQDAAATHLVRVCAARNNALDLLKAAIDTEVAAAGSHMATSLFRVNSVATKLMGAFGRLYGTQYLTQTIGPVLTDICTSGRSCEVDPAKLTRGTDVEENLANLRNATQSVLDAVFNSLSSCPVQIRLLCAHLAKTVSDRFPQSPRIGVACFFFLRFISPALVAPDQAGVAVLPDANARRSLVLVAKALQGAANGVPFRKERFMLPLNEWLEQAAASITNFYDLLATPPPEVPGSVSPLKISQTDDDVRALHRLVAVVMEKIAPQLARVHIAVKDEATTTSGSGVRSVRDALLDALRSLGPPPSAPPTSAADVASPALDKFLAQHAESIAALRESGAFFQRGISKAKNAVFYLVVRRLRVGATAEAVAAFILDTLKAHYASPFEIVIDALMARPSHIPPAATAAYILKLLPVRARSNAKAVYVLSPSKAITYACRKLHKLVVAAELERIIPLRDSDGLSEYIGEGQLALPPLPAVLVGPLTSFSPLSRVTKRSTKDVELRVGPRVFILMKLKATLAGKAVMRTDVYPLSTLAAVNAVGDEMSLTVKDESNLVTIRLRGSAVSRAAGALRAAITRAAATDAATLIVSDGDERTLDPASAPGTLLAAALLNISSTSSACREAAYHLIAAISTSFNLPSIALPESVGLMVPANASSLAVRLAAAGSSNHSHMTFDVLRAALRAVVREGCPYRHLPLTWLRPWLANLSAEHSPRLHATPETAARVDSVLHALIDAILREDGQFRAALFGLWDAIGRYADLAIMAACVCVARATGAGANTPTSEALSALCVSLATQQPVAVGGWLMKRTQEVLAALPVESKTLEQCSSFPELVVLLQFCAALVFDDNFDLTENLPDVLHVAILSGAAHEASDRRASRALLVNCVHALATGSAFPAAGASYAASRLAATSGVILRVTDQRGGYSAQAAGDIAMAIDDLLQSAAATSGRDAQMLVAGWRNRWADFAFTTAVSGCAALQPRALAVIGALATVSSAPQRVGRIVQHSAQWLHMALSQTYTARPAEALRCVASLIRRAPPSRQVAGALWWACAAVLTVSDARLFAAAGTLMLETLEIIGEDVEGATELARKQVSGLDDACSSLETTCGLSFATHFSVSVAAILIAGFTNTDTRPVSLELLKRHRGLGTNLLLQCVTETTTNQQPIVQAITQEKNDRELNAIAGLFGAAAASLPTGDVGRVLRLLGKCCSSTRLLTMLPHGRLRAALARTGLAAATTAAAATAVTFAAMIADTSTAAPPEQWMSGLNDVGPFQKIQLGRKMECAKQAGHLLDVAAKLLPKS